ncbi:MAG: branched-chain amino acid ABC transporter permease [Acidimicrobiia bacterium]
MSASSIQYLIFVGSMILLVWAFYMPFRLGQLYNGPVYCMAIGGYFAALVAKELGWPFFLALLGAALMGLIFGFLPALGFSRTTGVTTAVASMALIFIIQSVLLNLSITGGAIGVTFIPKVPYLLYATWGTVLVVGFLIYRLDHSRVGRAIALIGTDPDLARTLGINVRWMTVFSLTSSSVLGALAGVFYAFDLRMLRPGLLAFSLVLSASAMLFIGGRHTMWGVFISVPILWGLPQWLPPSIAPYTQFVYGAVLILVLVFRPSGLITPGLLRALDPRRSRRRRANEAADEVV